MRFAVSIVLGTRAVYWLLFIIGSFGTHAGELLTKSAPILRPIFLCPC